MLRKVCLHSLPEKRSCAEKGEVRCTVCKTITKSTFFLCKSGRHVLCETCQLREIQKIVKDHGDNVPEKELVLPSIRELIYTTESDTDLQDLASGDHIVAVDDLKISRSSKNTNKKNQMATSTPKASAIFRVKTEVGTRPCSPHPRPASLLFKPISVCPAPGSKSNKSNKGISKMNATIVPQDCCPKCEIEMTLKYKNLNYKESKSSVSTNVNISRKTSKQEKLAARDPRPVVCPVTLCARMVTIDSIPHHFNFDHSKVPKTLLYKAEPQEVTINYLTLSTDAKCVTFFIMSKKRSQTAIKKFESRTTVHIVDTSKKVVLLMAAKIQTTPTKFASRVSAKNSYTQTEDTKKEIIKQANSLWNSKSISNNLICRSKSTNNSDDVDDYGDEVILLWLCKLDDKDRVYTIMITREDNKESYSYTGNAINIRSIHNPFSIYSKAECLSLRRTAVNKLVTTENELKVVIVRTVKMK